MEAAPIWHLGEARTRGPEPGGVKSTSRVLVRNLRNHTVMASHAEIAATHLRRFVGLMGRTRNWARSGNGLWIRPSVGVHTFGMLFPIDVILLDQGLRAIHLQENLRPFRISAIHREARSVLELPPFTISKTGTCVGDPIEITFADGHEASLQGMEV
ncbi:MAG: DUF192 domain-containing protein [Terriglobia bacterium]